MEMAMDLFKVKRFVRARKASPEKDMEDKPVPPPEGMKVENGDDLSESMKVEPSSEAEEEEDDDDFILNEVKKRLKELRRNSSMGLIPEESCEEEEEEEEETSSSEWRSSEIEDHQPFYRFDEKYGAYCERMLFFDRMSAQRLLEPGSPIPSTPSPKSASKKLSSALRSLSMRKRGESQDDDELLQPPQDDPYQDLETAYVAHICLTWEALHCQYMQLSQKIASQPDDSTPYNHAAQHFQQFLVLLQRFIENEPFEQGLRVENYARARKSFPSLLQVSSIQGSERDLEESDLRISASVLIKLIEGSILTFHSFLKMDKKKSGLTVSLFGGQSQNASPLQLTQSTLDKKKMKLKELIKKKKGWKRKSWPTTMEEVELLFALIDVKVMSRTLSMARISKEQLLWCEEKLSKLDLSGNKLKRDASPVLFPC
ncbi:hypothetical protein Sjap_023034 [Stephania japonica]|uniref:Uncharacterized protein n=1 Tax=Stephania japonica TaxID=461633 RepID=A0AAP0ET13_9MAGN